MLKLVLVSIKKLRALYVIKIVDQKLKCTHLWPHNINSWHWDKSFKQWFQTVVIIIPVDAQASQTMQKKIFSLGKIFGISLFLLTSSVNSRDYRKASEKDYDYNDGDFSNEYDYEYYNYQWQVSWRSWRIFGKKKFDQFAESL